MKLSRISRRYKQTIAKALLLILLAEVLVPIQTWALTSGPSAPEFASFEPVGTTDMVNLFSGDFTYNLPVVQVPGPDGSGYSLSLSYHTGVNPEEEASWVGYGWTLNPGAINRQVKGFPDDDKEYSVKQYAKSPLNWTASAKGTVGMEVLSWDAANAGTSLISKALPTHGGLNLNGSTSVRFNNYNGFTRYFGYGLSVSGKNGSLNLSAGLGAQYGASGTTYQPNFGLSIDMNQYQYEPATKNNKEQRILVRTIRHPSPSLNLSGYTSMLTGINMAKPGLVPDRFTNGDDYKVNGFNLSFSQGFKLASVNIAMQYGLSGSILWKQDMPFKQFEGRGLLFADNINDDLTLSDYYCEQDNPFSAKLLFGSVPFANYDAFNITSDQLGGAFRYIPESLPVFFPNKRVTTSSNVNIGADLSAGEGIDIGLSLGAGSQREELSGNMLLNNGFHNGSEADRYNRFRLSGDMAGSVQYEDQTLDFPKYYDTSAPLSPKLIEPIKRSCQIYSITKDGNPYFKGSKNAQLPSSVAQLDDKSIRGFEVVGKDGANLRFGYPILSKNDLSLSVSSKRARSGPLVFGQSIPVVINNSGDLEVKLDQAHEHIQGQLKPDPYVNTYLLTDLKSANYLDINDNGVVDGGDIGGFTKFNYYKRWGHNNNQGNNQWYRWRTPYNGLEYQEGSIANQKDNMGSVTSGDKEIVYLSSIETPTHIAFFVTNKTHSVRFNEVISAQNLVVDTSMLGGSGKARTDGWDAAAINSTGDLASLSGTARGTHDLEYLEKIILIAKADPKLPIKIVKFGYDYSLVQGLPNSSGQSGQTGKLTLKKVWFEYGGVTKSRTLPYEFGYSYKPLADFPLDVRRNYPEDLNPNTYPTYSEALQNPAYKPSWLDPWGYAMPFATERKQDLIPWRYQGPLSWSGGQARDGWRRNVSRNAMTTKFDPACWQLKQVKLPSGGEILIEYEQKDYAYVQDKAPMAMASLVGSMEAGSSSTYFVEPEDLGLDPTLPNYDEMLKRQADLIKSYLSNTKLYFKFLYLLDSEKGSYPSLDNCNSEYITGYVNAATVDTATLQGGKKVIAIKLNEGYDEAESPRRACYDNYTNRRYGFWDGGDCSANFERSNSANMDDLVNGSNPLNKIVTTTSLLVQLLLILPDVSTIKVPGYETVGASLNHGLSFVKLPMLMAKKGGGVRVKRLLTYDPGLESGAGALFGHKFDYVTTREVDGKHEVISSGVATNEPAVAKEESPYKTFLPSANQTWLQKMIAGEDKAQFEGPIGESVLPAASVGHSKVIVSTIHSGTNGAGYSVREFYTAKDYPFEMTYDLTKPDGNVEKVPGVSMTDFNAGSNSDVFNLNVGIVSIETKSQSIRQGYQIRLNSMHGKERSNLDYSGTYVSYPLYHQQVADPVVVGTLVAGSVMEYYKPGEQLLVMKSDQSLAYKDLGVEEEVAAEQYRNQSFSTNFGLEFDLSLSSWALLSISVGGFNFDLSSQTVNSLTKAKVIRYPAVTKTVRSFTNGVWIAKSNIAYDQLSGNPVLVSITDEYTDQSRTSKMAIQFDVPAYWKYPALATDTVNRLGEVGMGLLTYGTDQKILDRGAKTWHWPDSVLKATVTAYDTGCFRWDKTVAGQKVYHDYYQSRGLILGSAQQRKLNQRYYPRSVYELNQSASFKVLRRGATRNGFAPLDGLTTNTVVTNIDASVKSSKKWLRKHTVRWFSPNGTPLEEVDDMNLVSFAAYDKQDLVPVLVGKNAPLSAVQFCDYEDFGFDSIKAHTGFRSRLLPMASVDSVVSLARIHQSREYNRGMLVQFWSDRSDLAQILVNNQAVSVAQSAHCNGWYRYETIVKQLPTDLLLEVKLLVTPAETYGHLDDFKVMPFMAHGKAYVYDKRNYRLLAEFDQQHFATIYQYNPKGELVRKMLETTRGIKTIEEQHLNGMEVRP